MLTRTGTSWRDLPERYGSRKTVYSRFRRWSKQGIWEQVFDALLEEAQQQGDLDWDLHYIDSTIVRAHQQAAGARKRGIKTRQQGAIRPQPRRLLHQAPHTGRRQGASAEIPSDTKPEPRPEGFCSLEQRSAGAQRQARQTKEPAAQDRG